MIVYSLDCPTDCFDDFTDLDDWLAEDSPRRTAWMLQAVLVVGGVWSSRGFLSDYMTRHTGRHGGWESSLCRTVVAAE